MLGPSVTLSCSPVPDKYAQFNMVVNINRSKNSNIKTHKTKDSYDILFKNVLFRLVFGILVAISGSNFKS